VFFFPGLLLAQRGDSAYIIGEKMRGAFAKPHILAFVSVGMLVVRSR